MSKHCIKWAILGTSPISYTMAEAIQQSELGELVAIGSRTQASAQQFAETFSLPKYYLNYHELLADKEIDVVYIGLPNHLHGQWMMLCAQAGKHILCEKPFVVSIKEAEEIITIIEKQAVFCLEALMYRHHPFITKLQEIIASDAIGKIQLYTATYTANISEFANPTAGGAIRNLGCYPVSLVRLLAGAEPTQIKAIGRMSQVNHTDNQASVLFQFRDQAIANISTADDIDMFWQFEIFGSKGCIKVETNPWLPTRESNKFTIYKDKNTLPIEIEVNADKPLYSYQIDYLSKQILTGNRGEFNSESLSHSLGNTIVLENWLAEVRRESQSVVHPVNAISA